MKPLPLVLLAIACPRPPVAGETGDCTPPADSRTPDSRAPDSGDSGGHDLGACDGLPWRLVEGTTGPDTAWAVAVTADGDVLLAAHEGQSLATDIVVRRLDRAGQPRWEGRWDSGRSDEAFAVAEGPDGTVWVGGLTRSGSVLDTDTAAVLLRFDGQTGTPLGQAFSWDSPGWDELDGLAAAEDGVYLSGWAQGAGGDGELRAYALDPDSLTPRWAASLDEPGLDAGNGALVLWDDLVIVGGSYRSTGVLGHAQGVVAAFGRADGARAWTSTVGDGSDYREILGLGSDGERVFAAGWRRVTFTDWQLALWAFDRTGAPLWETEWGGAGNERSRALAWDPRDDSLLVAGTTNGTGDDDVALLRVCAADGSLAEERTWGGPGGDGASGVALLGDRGFVAGPTRSWGAGDIDALGIGFCTRPWSLPSTD